MSTKVEQDTRSFARVNEAIPVRLRLVDEIEAEVLGRRYSAEPTYEERVTIEPNLRGGQDSQWEKAALSSILGRLERLERALVRIADSLSVDLTDAGTWVEGETASLSGSGAGILVPQRIDPGTPIEIELSLLGDPTILVRAVGRLVSVVHPDGESLPVGRYHLGVAFEAIHAEDREAIVRYTFRLQRAQLRQRHQDDDESDES